MSEPTVNIPLLRKAVEWAEAEAAKPVELCEWYQAAYVVRPEEREAEAKSLLSDGEDSPAALAITQKAPECGTCYCIAGYIISLTSTPVTDWDAMSIARAELGLPYIAAARLFSGDNTIEDVRRIAESIAGERL